MSLLTRHACYRHAPYLEGRGVRAAEEMTWVECAPTSPCPRCGARCGCTVSPDGRFVHCFTVVSAHPILGGGWLHRHTTSGPSRRFKVESGPTSRTAA